MSTHFTASLESFIQRYTAIAIPFSQDGETTVNLPAVLLHPVVARSFPSVRVLSLFGD